MRLVAMWGMGMTRHAGQLLTVGQLLAVIPAKAGIQPSVVARFAKGVMQSKGKGFRPKTGGLLLSWQK
ncbi:hypothetical protein QLQ15_04370 [Lysobacter sp. LF1]|uniref:Uncharacterized protein n=1 Tax=Lysobacter stagni TaxID=3045172 RepID=A0ABT6XDZ0_9GAMM|nr:hypothetical protein [Lysobacter sp. LF1]MDI9238143.1 hypothetical protein [Lysobacter sp. LF1]